MRNMATVIFTSVLLAGTAIPAHAQSLLGGLVGDGGSNSLITITDGPASDTGLVNLGLGGGGGNLVDVGLGGTNPLATVNVSTGSGSAIGADVSVPGAADVSADVGGGSLVDIDADVLGGGVGVTIGVLTPGGLPVTPGGGVGTPGLPGAPGVIPGGGWGRVANTRTGGGAACVGQSPNDVARLIQSTRVDASWSQASNVSIQPVVLCPDVKIWLSSQLAGSGLGATLQNAVAGDALISASLSRSSYGPQQVFAVQRSGQQLTVFVY